MEMGLGERFASRRWEVTSSCATTTNTAGTADDASHAPLITNRMHLDSCARPPPPSLIGSPMRQATACSRPTSRGSSSRARSNRSPWSSSPHTWSPSWVTSSAHCCLA
eukprot:3354626-Pleurochrysis_carterae.AAC.1